MCLLPEHFRWNTLACWDIPQGSSMSWNSVLGWYRPVFFDAKVVWNNLCIFPGDIQKAHWEITCSLLASENLLNLLKCTLRKSYQSQRIVFKQLQASLFSSASFNSLYYSLNIISVLETVSGYLFSWLCFGNLFLQPSCFKWNNSA